MAFCSKCGTKLTEGAKFCPKCGESVQSTEEKPKSVVDAFKEGWREGEKGSHNEPSSKESLSTWEKIALGVAGFVAFTGICGGIGDGMWIAVLISLCAMGAICAVFMGTIDKKYAWTTAIASFFIVCMTVAATTDDKEEKQNQAQTEQKKEKVESKEEKKYRESRGTNIDMARVAGQSAARESANDLIRQGYSESDLKGRAAQQARLKYKSVEDCCNLEYFEKNYKELFTSSERQKLVEQCREAYVIGYMSALGN